MDTNITKIKARAFYGCESLKEIMLEKDNLKKVGKDAFAGTNTKVKLLSYTMSKGHASKVKSLFTGAGIKKVYFKRKHSKNRT